MVEESGNILLQHQRECSRQVDLRKIQTQMINSMKIKKVDHKVKHLFLKRKYRADSNSIC